MSQMWAMSVKEFRQLRRDRRTMALLVALPLVFLVVFGYAASFDVPKVTTLVVGPQAPLVAAGLPRPFSVESVQPLGTVVTAFDDLQKGRYNVAFVASPPVPQILVDGSQLFAATATLRTLAVIGQSNSVLAQTGVRPQVRILFNPGLKTSAIMIPALVGLILLFVGTVVTSLGVVRERQAGTLEQLAVMPFRASDVFIGKIAPYFAVALLDMAIIATVGVVLFHVPFNGSVWVLALGGVLFLFVTLGIGVLISTVSENSGQAIQLAIMTLLPQVLLSGMIFPLDSMAAGVRWIGYLLPLTYFNMISRGVMLRGAPLTSLWFPFVLLAVLGTVVFTAAVLRFRRDLAPSARTLAKAAA